VEKITLYALRDGIISLHLWFVNIQEENNFVFLFLKKEIIYERSPESSAHRIWTPGLRAFVEEISAGNLDFV
jgi:hypothetical protein